MGRGTVTPAKPNGVQDEGVVAGSDVQEEGQARKPLTAHELISVSIIFTANSDY
jgi:hypothetical protein